MRMVPFVISKCSFFFSSLLELIAVGVGLGDYTDLLSFFNLFRICRIFKITRQFDGTKVLVVTVYRSYEALVIQILFLFTMCLTFGFLLFYIEPCLGNNINAVDDTCEFPDLLQSTYFFVDHDHYCWLRGPNTNNYNWAVTCCNGCYPGFFLHGDAFGHHWKQV